jgi:hypothetical protein
MAAVQGGAGIQEKPVPFRTKDSSQAVEDTLVEALVTLETDHERTQSTPGFDWIVTIRLNAHSCYIGKRYHRLPCSTFHRLPFIVPPNYLSR